MGILQQWKLNADELDDIMTENRSLRGFTFGYVCEYKVRKLWFSDERVQNVQKYDDHDRTRKGDIAFDYKGVRISVEVKSFQSNSIRQTPTGYGAKFQCDASDRRKVELPNGEEVETTCLVVREFDLLAVSLFQFHNDWVFAFAKNEDLPRSSYRKYTVEQQQYLLASTMAITWPIVAPYELDPFPLLDRIVEEKKRGQYEEPVKIEKT